MEATLEVMTLWCSQAPFSRLQPWSVRVTRQRAKGNRVIIIGRPTLFLPCLGRASADYGPATSARTERRPSKVIHVSVSRDMQCNVTVPTSQLACQRREKRAEPVCKAKVPSNRRGIGLVVSLCDLHTQDSLLHS